MEEPKKTTEAVVGPGRTTFRNACSHSPSGRRHGWGRLHRECIGRGGKPSVTESNVGQRPFRTDPGKPGQPIRHGMARPYGWGGNHWPRVRQKLADVEIHSYMCRSVRHSPARSNITNDVPPTCAARGPFARTARHPGNFRLPYDSFENQCINAGVVPRTAG